MTDQLVQALGRRTNHQGLVIAREAVLLDELRIGADELRVALQSLADTGAIEVLSPQPYLAIKLKKWLGHGSETSVSAPNAYSYSKQLFDNKAFKADSYRPDELAADGGLLHEILETLGETDPQSFRKAIENYSPHVIRTALSRVRRAKSIRKNRTALFRHLLPRIAQGSQHAS
jgi:hypothetical protein